LTLGRSGPASQRELVILTPMTVKRKLLGKLGRAISFRFTPFKMAMAVTLAVMALVIYRPLFCEVLELKLYDLKFRLRGPRPPGPEVVIVAIDDASLKKLGRWPWSREVMAQLLTRLKEAKPRVIALDIIFAERQETAAITTINNLRRDITSSGEASPKLLGFLAKEEQRADADKRLVQVISQKPPTLLGFFFRGVEGKSPLKPGQMMEATAPPCSTYNLVRWLDAKPATLPIVGAEGIELNLPELAAAAAGSGYFNMVPDIDGTVRWLPQAIVYGPDFFTPLSLATAQYYKGRPPLGLTLSHLGVEVVRLGNLQIPVDRLGRLLIDYYGPAGSFPHYSAAAVWDGQLPAEALKDKIVLLGATAVGVYDLRVTPFSGVCPGIEIQATIIDNILRGQFLRTPRTPQLPIMLIVLALGLLLGVVLPRLSAVWSFIFALLLAEAYAAINFLLFSRAGLQLELFYPLLVIGGIYTGTTVQSFLAEEKERARVKKAFQSYVAPEVVNEILKHPELLHLGGERRELTILFSDIRGFTSLAETLEPEVLVGLLHDFLNPMSEIIVEHSGTIDKYIGDAVMALFGAPLKLPEHATLACRTALAMIDKLKTLSAEWEAKGRPPMRIGVGLNTGPVAVGNMGSDRLFNYTAIGDNVNLASRLEGLTKHYGSDILISAATAEALEGQFILREVDLVRVKGKTRPLVIYELLGEGTPDPELAQFLEFYREGRGLYRDRQFRESAVAFARALELRPEDLPSRTYLELSEKYLLSPPGRHWEPVRTMQQK
jgi:adenylate cyclase